MDNIEQLKKEYKTYKDILKSVYDIRRLSKNKKLDSYISYLKGVKKGLEISINSING